jgi:protein phosphatase
MVADGVGGGVKGEEASRVALERVTQYVSDTMRCYYATGAQNDQEFTDALQEAALHSSAELRRLGEEDPDYQGMATTLTLYLGVWPRAYLLQVGDSRCYLFRNGDLRQITRDQTMAQELLDIGVLKPTDSAMARFSRTLSSSIGGRMTDPVVTRLDMTWGTVVLLCSDGLTAHVPDGRIRERLSTMTSAKQTAEDLLRDALDGGGEDNITVIVGRALRKAG